MARDKKEQKEPPPKPPTMAEAMREQSQMVRAAFDGLAVSNRELASALRPPGRNTFGQREPALIGDGAIQHAYIRSARSVLRKVPKTHWRPRPDPETATIACQCRRAMWIALGGLYQCRCRRVFLYTGRGMFVVNVEKLPEITDILRAAMVVVGRS